MRFVDIILAAVVAAMPLQPATAETKVTVSSKDDRAMNAAKKKGHDTLPFFLERLASPASDETSFLIKFNLGTEEDPEFIWADDLRVDGAQITGALANEPMNPAHKLGERVTISRPSVVDWGYYKGRVMQGNFTTRVQLEQLSAEEAAQIRQALGW